MLKINTMDSIKNYILVLLIIIMCSALVYKVYLEDKIKNPENPSSILSILAFRKYGIISFLPLSMSCADKLEKSRRAKANRALIIFYLCFATVLVISLF